MHYQKIIANGFLYILEIEIDWDGVDYPYQSKTVWQAPLTNEKECADLNAFYKATQKQEC